MRRDRDEQRCISTEIDERRENEMRREKCKSVTVGILCGPNFFETIKSVRFLLLADIVFESGDIYNCNHFWRHGTRCGNPERRSNDRTRA